MWSFACVLECLDTHRHVYDEGAAYGGAAALLRRIENEQVRPSATGLLAEIIERCSRFDPEERCSFAEAVELLGASNSPAGTRLPPGPGRLLALHSRCLRSDCRRQLAGRSLVHTSGGAAACSSASRRASGSQQMPPRERRCRVFADQWWGQWLDQLSRGFARPQEVDSVRLE